MIFTAHQPRTIARGRRSTIRIPVKPGKAGAPYAPCPFKLGHEYAIPEPVNPTDRAAITRGDKPQPPPIAHVRVTANPREHLRITAQQAKTEGHDSIDAFKRAWVRQHDRAWIDRHERDFNWARYVGGGIVSAALLERYRQRWEGREVWAIHLELVTDVRYMAQPDPVKAQGDYTLTRSRAIDDLPVIEAALQERYTKAARIVSLATRQTFQADLERERAIRKGERRPYPSSEQRAA